ncbi:MAG: glycosyltransferase [Candidatus Omnitrophica bacterium]|nr:glycosyltransferase [Candidatus Omnitrophota bacterium]
MFIFVFSLLRTAFPFSIYEGLARRVRFLRDSAISIPTVLAGMGHIRAFQAIEKALREISGNVEVKGTDPLDYYSPKVPELINQLYLWMIKSPLRGLWGALYESNIISSVHSPFRWLITQIYARAIHESLKDSPQVIVSTHPFITLGAASLKREGILKTPLVYVATDFDVHPLGINEEVDIFVVPDISIGMKLKEMGVPEEKIKVLGIPIDSIFSKEISKMELRQKLGLGETQPTVLIIGGGFGIGPIEKLVSSFKNFKKPLQLLVVVGKNEELKQRIEKMEKDLGIEIEVFGYIENIDELMGASDLVITKPGGLTIAEALAKNLPFILIEPVGGQEEKNLEFAIEKGVAIYAKQIEEIPKIIGELFENPSQLELMRVQAKKLAHPNSAREIAMLLLELTAQKKKEN